jgi:tetratricopeptide (TPR) repeat protein
VVRRPQASSPACARNAGARQARGELLFFLDGDDLFLPGHVTACWEALRDGGLDYLKTGVRLSDPVHPDWKERIANSIVINACVRRWCHEAVGGFPDYHLFRRDNEQLRPTADVFFKVEDLFYNRLLARLFRGRTLAEETVEYCRRPGNAFDRQYEKFRRPFGAIPDDAPEEERFRLRLGEVIFHELATNLERGRPRGEAAAAALAGARERLRAGDMAQAERLCRQALEDGPGDAELFQVLGAALLGKGKAGEAAAAFEQAVRLRPDSADAQLGLGQALAASSRREEAALHYREALRLRPGHPDATAALGLALAEMGRPKEALPFLHEAARLRPDSATAHHNLGVALAQAGRPQEAVGALEGALRLKPDYPEACYNLGNVLRELGRRDEAIERFRQALQQRPTYAEALNNLGLALTEAGRPGEAAVLLRQAARLRPQMKEAHNNLGLAMADLGRFAGAEGCYERALALDSGYAEAHVNLGSCFKERGRTEEAIACYDQALRLDPKSASARYNQALALLQQGDYERGWAEYEWRWKRPQTPPRPFKQPRWDGSPLEGRTILLWCEQGLGDTLQFVRYAALVKARAGTVVLECPPRLVPLLSTCTGADRLVSEGEPLPGFDVQAPLLSLPGLLGTTLETVPMEGPYLHAEPQRVERWRERLESVEGLRVGIVWQGNPKFQWDRWRSVPLEEFAPLAEVEGVRLVSLQRRDSAEQVRREQASFPVVDLGGELDVEGAFLDTAAVMRCLDLVVTADTAAAHLAGALGVPVWVALARMADWRWGRKGEGTPWYPTMRLFRQGRLGRWGAVIRRLAERLHGLAAERSRRPGLRVEVSAGELLDKITILEIKAERIADPGKLAHVRAELGVVRRAWGRPAADPAKVARLTQALRATNEALWEAEDQLRLCERAKDFGPQFVELARAVYRHNDDRAGLKRRVSELLGSPWYEQKGYSPGE